MFFFFSSRRRHTRFDCDWSSDVCSSDLRAAGDNATANAIAFLVFMGQRSTHGNNAVVRGCPAANGGMLQIVSRVSAFGSETHPTEFLVRPLRTALPRFVNEVRQRHKTFHTLRLLVVFAKAVLPRRNDRLERFRRRRGVRFGQKPSAQFNLSRRRRPLENKPVKVLNPLFGLLERSHLGSRGQRSGALDHERTRSEERRVGKECRSRWSPYHLK